MYDYILGKLTKKTPTLIVVDAAGVGYLFFIPLSTFHNLPAEGDDVKILAHLQVREDAHTLFGFFTEEEREMFRKLISISGIGPKVALTVLSGIGIDEFKRAVINEKMPVLTGISGIGKKMAERIIIELREKIVLSERDKGKASVVKLGSRGTLVEDSAQALVALGYSKQKAMDAIEKVMSDKDSKDTSVENLIRESLKQI